MYSAMRPLAATAAARNIAVRAMEHGGQLVAAPLSGVLAVLQMPRGNLEGVFPRPLVLAAIARALDRAQYARAWRLATVHRVGRHETFCSFPLSNHACFPWPEKL